MVHIFENGRLVLIHKSKLKHYIFNDFEHEKSSSELSNVTILGVIAKKIEGSGFSMKLILPEASTYFVNASHAKKMYLFPASLSKNGPAKSTHIKDTHCPRKRFTMNSPKSFCDGHDRFQRSGLCGPNV